MPRSPQGAIGYTRRPRFGLWLVLIAVVLAAGGQAVPLYTDWLWFKEVGFTQVFTTRLTLSGWLFIGLGAAVLVVLYANLSLAARTAPPDVYWELEDQLGLPGRAILEPLVRRLLLPVVSVIAFFSGVRGAAGLCWDATDVTGLYADVALEHFPDMPSPYYETYVLISAGLAVRSPR